MAWFWFWFDWTWMIWLSGLICSLIDRLIDRLIDWMIDLVSIWFLRNLIWFDSFDWFIGWLIACLLDCLLDNDDVDDADIDVDIDLFLSMMFFCQKVRTLGPDEISAQWFARSARYLESAKNLRAWIFPLRQSFFLGLGTGEGWQTWDFQVDTSAWQWPQSNIKLFSFVETERFDLRPSSSALSMQTMQPMQPLLALQHQASMHWLHRQYSSRPLLHVRPARPARPAQPAMACGAGAASARSVEDASGDASTYRECPAPKHWNRSNMPALGFNRSSQVGSTALPIGSSGFLVLLPQGCALFGFLWCVLSLGISKIWLLSTCAVKTTQVATSEGQFMSQPWNSSRRSMDLLKDIGTYVEKFCEQLILGTQGSKKDWMHCKDQILPELPSKARVSAGENQSNKVANFYRQSCPSKQRVMILEGSFRG